jgi:uncharacterized protein
MIAPKDNNEKEKIKTLVIPVLKKYGIRKASFFGSIVKNTRKNKSDVDILVEFEKGKSLFDLVRLKREIEDTIKLKTDLLTYKSLHPLLRESILSEHEIFYEERAKIIL